VGMLIIIMVKVLMIHESLVIICAMVAMSLSCFCSRVSNAVKISWWHWVKVGASEEHSALLRVDPCMQCGGIGEVVMVAASRLLVKTCKWLCDCGGALFWHGAIGRRCKVQWD